MASAITHLIVGAALALPARFDGVLPRWAVPVTGGLFAAAPDLDTPLMFSLDIPWGSLFAHSRLLPFAVFPGAWLFPSRRDRCPAHMAPSGCFMDRVRHQPSPSRYADGRRI